MLHTKNFLSFVYLQFVLPGYWISAWKPEFFSKIAIFCTNPKAEKTCQLQEQMVGVMCFTYDDFTVFNTLPREEHQL